MTRVKIGSDFVAEQNEEWSEKRVIFCSYRCFLESEKLRRGKKISKRAKFFAHVRHFEAVFVFHLCGYNFVLILSWFW